MMLKNEMKKMRFLENKAKNKILNTYKMKDILKKLDVREQEEYEKLWLKFTSPVVDRRRYVKK